MFSGTVHRGDLRQVAPSTIDHARLTSRPAAGRFSGVSLLRIPPRNNAGSIASQLSPAIDGEQLMGFPSWIS
jgi:hypothetical protein